MKLQYLAVFVSAIVMTGATHGVEIYNKDGNKLDILGKLHGIRYLSNDSNNANSDHSLAIGLKGETQISNELVGFGNWEYSILTQHGGLSGVQNERTRLSFVGMKLGNIGTIDYGRNYGILYDVSSFTNVMPGFGGDTILADNFMSGLADDVLTYRNSNFFGIADGLSFALQYQGKNDMQQDKGPSLKDSNGDGYGISIGYNLGNGISADAAYTNSNRTIAQRATHVEQDPVAENKNKKAEAYSLGVKYDANDVYLAALYSETHNMTPVGNFVNKATNDKTYGFAKTAKNVELIAQYKFDFGLRPSLGYLQSRIDNDFKGKIQDTRKYMELGTSYNFNKNMLAFIDYRINLLTPNDFLKKEQISTGNVVAMGMTYTF